MLGAPSGPCSAYSTRCRSDGLPRFHSFFRAPARGCGPIAMAMPSSGERETSVPCWFLNKPRLFHPMSSRQRTLPVSFTVATVRIVPMVPVK
jgi:hypothetical protein